MTKKICNLLKKNKTLIADGAMGTNLFNLQFGSGNPPEILNLERPLVIQKIHEEYLNSGSNIIMTNSFGGNSARLSLHNLDSDLIKINKNAVTIAKTASKRFKNVLVAGSVGPTGEIIEPIGNLSFKKAQNIFFEQIEVLANEGVDLIWIETMSCLKEARAAILSAKKFDLPIICTMSFDSFGKTMMGITPNQFQQFAYEHALDGYGANCGIGPSEIIDTILQFQINHQDNIPVVSKVNCGIPRMKNNKIVYPFTPEILATYSLLARDAGAKIIGGCCGTDSNHIKKISSSIKNSAIGEKPTIEKIIKIFGIPWGKITVTKKRRRKRLLRKKIRKNKN